MVVGDMINKAHGPLCLLWIQFPDLKNQKQTKTNKNTALYLEKNITFACRADCSKVYNSV